jgi:hypothetical protein
MAAVVIPAITVAISIVDLIIHKVKDVRLSAVTRLQVERACNDAQNKLRHARSVWNNPAALEQLDQLRRELEIVYQWLCRYHGLEKLLRHEAEVQRTVEIVHDILKNIDELINPNAIVVPNAIISDPGTAAFWRDNFGTKRSVAKSKFLSAVKQICAPVDIPDEFLNLFPGITQGKKVSADSVSSYCKWFGKLSTTQMTFAISICAHFSPSLPPVLNPSCNWCLYWKNEKNICVLKLSGESVWKELYHIQLTPTNNVYIPELNRQCDSFEDAFMSLVGSKLLEWAPPPMYAPLPASNGANPYDFTLLERAMTIGVPSDQVKSIEFIRIKKSDNQQPERQSVTLFTAQYNVMAKDFRYQLDFTDGTKDQISLSRLQNCFLECSANDLASRLQNLYKNKSLDQTIIQIFDSKSSGSLDINSPSVSSTVDSTPIPPTSSPELNFIVQVTFYTESPNVTSVTNIVSHDIILFNCTSKEVARTLRQNFIATYDTHRGGAICDFCGIGFFQPGRYLHCAKCHIVDMCYTCHSFLSTFQDSKAIDIKYNGEMHTCGSDFLSSKTSYQQISNDILFCQELIDGAFENQILAKWFLVRTEPFRFLKLLEDENFLRFIAAKLPIFIQLDNLISSINAWQTIRQRNSTRH